MIDHIHATTASCTLSQEVRKGAKMVSDAKKATALAQPE